MNVQFVTNSKGKVIAIQLPLKDWKEVEQKLEAFNISESVKTGYKEIQQIENGQLKAKSLEQFLNEL